MSTCRDSVTDDPAIDGVEDAATTAAATSIASAATAANDDATAMTAAACSAATTTATTTAAPALRRRLRAGSDHHQRCRAGEAETVNPGQNHSGNQTRKDALTTGWNIRHEVSLL